MVVGDHVEEVFAPPSSAAAVPEHGGNHVGSSERALASLKSFARIAWEECRKPLTDAAGSAQVRWEIYSSWTLLLCLHHTEAESERCQATWKPQRWRTEAQGLRHIFLQSRSARIISAVLRWLRWAHRWKPPSPAAPTSSGAGHDAGVRDDGGDASYERTRRAMQLRSALPCPLQGAPSLHPDGPLQQREQFNVVDLEDERLLLRQLWTYLRRGDLYGALKHCSDRGQAWRTALLQGMLPFADSLDEPVGYDAIDEDKDEDVLTNLKAEHTDWTELGELEWQGPAAGSNGNPWRRLWKEQCWDTAQRGLQPANSAMDSHELAIYGFCAGHCEAMLPVCKGTWPDRLWGELHCLKEWLVERLLDTGGAEWTDGAIFLGEGDGGVLDVDDTPDAREERSRKLCGLFVRTQERHLDAVVALEVRRLLARLRADPASPWLCEAASAAFPTLQATLIEAAWAPEQNEVALGMLRQWLADGLDGEPCAFLVKQFAAYFAIWHKEAKATADVAFGMGVDPAEQVLTPPQDVDDIVRSLVRHLSAVAADSWVEQCLEGQAVELIVEHMTALTIQGRLDAYVRFLFELGVRAAGPSATDARRRSGDRVGASVQDGEGAGGSSGRPGRLDRMDRGGREGGGATPESILRAEVLKQCMWVFWVRFPQEAFLLLAVLVGRALCLADDASGVAEEQPPRSVVSGALSAQMKQPELRVNVIGAQDLRNADYIGKSDPYCIVKIQGKSSLKTKVIDDCLNPVWNEEFLVKDYVVGDLVEFIIMDQDMWPKSDDVLGTASLASSQFYPNGFDGVLPIVDIEAKERQNSTLAVKVEVLRVALDSSQELPSLATNAGLVGASADEIGLAVECLIASWVVLRDKVAQHGPVVAEVFSGIGSLLGPIPTQVAGLGTADFSAQLALESIMLPLLLDTIFSLAVKDVKRAVALYDCHLRESLLWRDAFSSESKCAEGLSELEWYLGLWRRHAEWEAAHAKLTRHLAAEGRLRPGRLPTAPSGSRATGGATGQEVESACTATRDAFIDYARLRLQLDRPLLEPYRGTRTTLPAESWESMRGAIAGRVLTLLTDVFEQAGDFEGALGDLIVAVADSPWMLKLTRPESLRAFLHRVAFIPTRLPVGEGSMERQDG